MKKISILCVIGLFIVSGCSSTQSCDRSSPNSPDRKKSIEVFGSDIDLAIYIVPSQGGVNDAVVSAMSTAGPSRLSRHLAANVEQIMSQNGRLDLTVTGSNSIKTKISLIKALELFNGKSMPTLRILFIGNPADRDEVEKAVKALNAKFFFADINNL